MAYDEKLIAHMIDSDPQLILPPQLQKYTYRLEHTRSLLIIGIISDWDIQRIMQIHWQGGQFNNLMQKILCPDIVMLY